MTRLAHIAKEALVQGRTLGFDHLTISALVTKTFGVRIAQSVICRENVWHDDEACAVQGIWQTRSGHTTCQPASASDLVKRLQELRRDLTTQSPNRESVLPALPTGRLSWEIAPDDFEQRYSPEMLYPALAPHLEKVRQLGLRATGYIEAQEVAAHTFAHNGLELFTRDHGLTISITIDDPVTGICGAASRASELASPAELEALLTSAFAQATATCRTSGDAVATEPGDYTVILHPAAVLDLLGTALMYGLFDRRKIDEGRTYLSHKGRDLRYPAGLRLSQTLQLPLAHGTYADLPLNERLVPCASLDLITNGQVKDQHTTPFWAQEKGLPETFSAYGGPPLHLHAPAASPLKDGHGSIDDLIRSTKRGIYVQNTWYLRMVTEMEGVITGMTRDGLYEIRDGEITRPLINMRWHDNPFRILSAVSGMSAEAMLLGRSRLSGRGRSPLALVPALRVEDFHFSSATKF